jgi:hypothetical protein
MGIAHDQPGGRRNAIPLAHEPLQNTLFRKRHRLNNVNQT